MTHSRSRRLKLLTAGCLLVLSACGKKGPPLPPLRIVPARIEDLAIVKTDDVVTARFTIPSANDNKSQPADIVAVELYALSGKPEDPFGQTLSGPDFLRFGQLVGRLEVEPPPDPEKPSDPEKAPPEGVTALVDPRPAQGEIGTIAETIDEADRQPFVHPRKKQTAAPAAERSTVLVRPLGPPPAEDVFSRTYLAVGVNRRGQKAAPSNRVAVPLLQSPAPPPAVKLDHTETSAVVTWEEAPGARRRVQRPPDGTEIPARALAQNVAATTYNVYVVNRSGSGEVVSPTPVNAAPVDVLTVSDTTARLGEERCYQVRSLQAFGNARLESRPSATVCRTLTDTFAPAAPTNLAAVGSEGGVSLIWEPNKEPDLGGYLVLRGEVTTDGSAAVLKPLMTEPLRETTYRDTTPKPGVRYLYAVVAVDNATPRNQSPESNRVEEGSR